MPPETPLSAAVPRRRPAIADDVWLQAWVADAWRRWRVLAGLYGVVLALAVALVIGAVVAGLVTRVVPVAAISGILVLVFVVAGTPGVADVRAMLFDVERRLPALRNALVAWQETRGRVTPAIRTALASQARDVLGDAPWPRPHGTRAWVLALACLAAGVAAHGVRPAVRGQDVPRDLARAAPPVVAPDPGALDWRVTLTPPSYTRLPARTLEHPRRVELLSGTRIDLRFARWPSAAMARLGSVPLRVDGQGATRTASLSPSASDVLLILGQSDVVLASVAIVVRPDAPPRVRVTAPAADLRRTAATGVVPIHVTAQDDLGLRDLRLRYTRVSGSGESFTFVDGEWTVRVRRSSATSWQGMYELDLSTTGLGPGDSLVYHAVAHDARLGAEGAAESERYLIEIPPAGAVAGGDFSLPDRGETFALSQRMVIQMTQRLLEARPRMAADDYRQQAQALAIAQRRVRAEFVFMLGGEVEDEVEEAAHAHEVEAGRLDNRGQGDLTEAVREMSQAESRLTDAALREALPYEYRALAALQAAFGKARYFMRTLPAPVRIDTARRLQGDRTGAASASWERRPLAEDQQSVATDLARRLDAIPSDDRRALAGLLPALVALDRGDADWVALVQGMPEPEGRAAVARALRQRLLARSPAWLPMPLPRSAAEASLSGPPGAPRR